MRNARRGFAPWIMLGMCAVAAACGPKHTAANGTGTGSGSDTGSGTGTGAGTGSTTTGEAPVVVDWSKAGVDWSEIPGAGAEPAFKPPVPVSFKLKNGIKVILVENHRLPLVSLRIVNARAGAREEGTKYGLAALTADMLDEGAGSLDALALPEAVEMLGASLDTGVAEDATMVWLDTLAATLDDSLALLADVMMRPRLDAKDFDRVKADTLEDLKLRPQEPRRVASLVFDKLVMGAHPYGEPASGYVATVERLELADVKAFWKKQYAPSQTTIVVAGDVDRKHLAKLLEKRFGVWKSKKLGNAKAPKAPEAPDQLVLAFVDRPGAPQSVVMIGRSGLKAGDKRHFPAEVANMALGDSFASRLNNRLREQLGYTYGIFTGFWPGEWAGTWAASTSFKTNVTVAGIEEALSIIKNVRDQDLPATELAKAQQLMTRALPQSFETNGGIVSELSDLVIKRMPGNWHQSFAAGINKVTAAEARQAAADTMDGLSIVVVGDWAVVGKDLERIGLPIVRFDTEGKRVE